MPKRLIVCISGSGSNLQAILDEIVAERLPAEVALVVSNRRAAAGLARAERAGIPTFVKRVDHFTSRPYWDRAMADTVAALSLIHI